MKFLKFIKSNLPYFIFLVMILGLINGYMNSVGYLKKLVTPTLFLMIYPMMINLKVTDLFEGFSNPKPLLISIIVNFTLSPLLVYGLSKLFFSNRPELMVGLILISLIPTSGMTASWTGLAGGNMKSALLMISGNLLLSIIMIPIYMKIFLGKIVTINTMTIIISLVKVVVVPLVLGDLTRRFIIKSYGLNSFKKIKPQLGAISSIGVLLIVFIAMSLKSKTIINQSSLVLYSIMPLILYYGALLLFGHIIGKTTMNDGDQIALVYGTSMRNLTIALGLSLSAFGESLAVFLIAIGYIVQVPMAAIYMQRIKK